MTFDEFMAKVDAHLYNVIGLAHDDMEDHLWADAWRDGADPVEEADDFASEQLEGWL